ncbi:MAG: hypothetical protein E7585_01770 [Ruminococcaceae bacterium]|nr:hypothetical protein [Oscillospiraceae bacterium]
MYKYPFWRIAEAVNDFWRALALVDLFEISLPFPIEQTVNDFSKVDLWQSFGIDLSEIYRKIGAIGAEIFVWKHFRVYLMFLLFYTVKILYAFCLFIIVALLVCVPLLLTWDDVNNDYNKDTVPLRLFKLFVAKPYRWIKDRVLDVWSFFRNTYWWRLFWALWLLYFGVYTVILEFAAYYLWLITTLSFSTIHIQLMKLIVDILLMFHTLPWFCWVAIGIWIYERWRLSYGADKLYAFSAHNKRLLKELPMCNYIVGLMRSGKDMMMNDMAITFSALDRDANLEILNENMLKFPRFPWILFELDIQQQIKSGKIRSWTSAREWVKARYRSFCVYCDQEHIWQYRADLYPMRYNDGLKVISLWDALEEYAQAYFSYTLSTSYLISTAPVRDDFMIQDEGNFKLVDTNYLARDPEYMKEVSQYSHIVDWDMFRLGVKIKRDNPNIGAFEFGILVFTEIDKERKNNDQLKETKAKDEESNQKNDLFNLWVKMSGHGAMLANRCMLHMLTNAQRPTSWGADGHELCAVLHIEKHKGADNALPFFWVEEGVIGAYLAWWNGIWDESRYKWGNHHLITWLGQGFAAILFRYMLRRKNLFGYYRQKIITEVGTSEEHKHSDEMSYIVMYRQAYAERYASDYFKAFSAYQTERCAVGMNDLPAYQGKYPTLKEMSLSHSHLNKDLFKYHQIDFNDKEPVERYDCTDENLDPEDFERKE